MDVLPLHGICTTLINRTQLLEFQPPPIPLTGCIHTSQEALQVYYVWFQLQPDSDLSVLE